MNKKSANNLPKVKPITVEDAHDWCLMAYAETRSRGFYTAYKFQGVRSRDIFNIAALMAGLVHDVKDENGKQIRVWKDLEHVPNKTDATNLFHFFEKYKAAEKRKVELKKEQAAKMKAEAKAATKPLEATATAAKPEPVTTGAMMMQKLDSMEKKLDALLRMWVEQ